MILDSVNRQRNGCAAFVVATPPMARSILDITANNETGCIV